MSWTLNHNLNIVSFLMVNKTCKFIIKDINILIRFIAVTREMLDKTI